MKLVPLLRSSVSSDGRLMEVKLWTLLVVESFFFFLDEQTLSRKEVFML